MSFLVSSVGVDSGDLWRELGFRVFLSFAMKQVGFLHHHEELFWNLLLSSIEIKKKKKNTTRF
jgi:hypothetical protein